MIRLLLAALLAAFFVAPALAATGDPLDRTLFSATPSFDDEFGGAFESQPGPQWTRQYSYSPPAVYPNGTKPTASQLYFGHAATATGETEVYVDPVYCAAKTNDPHHDDTSMAARQMNGFMVITAWPADAWEIANCGAGKAKYLSGLLTTQLSFTQTYGYFEIRAALPKTGWPAFWLLSAAKPSPPAQQEIDVMEHWGPEKYGHPQATAHDGVNSPSDLHTPPTLDPTAFHTYGLLWEPRELIWYIDGKEVFRTTEAFATPHYLLLNLAISAAEAPATAQQFMIDYVRAYPLTH